MMTKLSSVDLEKKKMDLLYDHLWEAIGLLGTKQEIENFFSDLLTHTERKMLAKRFQVAMMLLGGHDYQTIKASLKVTDITIAKINNWLKTGATELAKVAKELISLKEGKDKIGGERSRGRYLAGDLLLPAVEAGLDLAARQLRKRRQKKLMRP